MWKAKIQGLLFMLGGAAMLAIGYYNIQGYAGIFNCVGFFNCVSIVMWCGMFGFGCLCLAVGFVMLLDELL